MSGFVQYLLVGLLCVSLLGATSMENPGFEDGAQGWVISGDSGISKIAPEGAREGGRLGLVIQDEKPDRGSSVSSGRFPVKGSQAYAVSWWAKVLSGSGIAVYFRFYDRGGKILNEGKNTLEFKDLEWKKCRIRAESPPDSVEADVWVRSYVKSIVTAHLDDFEVEEVAQGANQDPARLDRKRAPTEPEIKAMAALRGRWKDMLTGGPPNNKDEWVRAKLDAMSQSAGDYWKAMATDSGVLWPDLTDMKDAAQVSRAYSRLRSMALAYTLSGTRFSGNLGLVQDTIRGLDWLHSNAYNETKGDVGSWYEREIGTPQCLNDILILIREDIPADKRERYLRSIYHFAGNPGEASYELIEARRGYEYVGANRVWRCLNLMLAGASREDPEKCALAEGRLGEVFDYVTTGEGWYRDGSFIAHQRHPYTGGYGKSLFIQIVNLLYLTAGTPWDCGSRASAQNIYHWVHDGIEPLLVGCSMMDMVRGREISRAQAQGRAVGFQVLQAIFRLSLFAPEAHRGKLRFLVKTAVGPDWQPEFLRSSPIDLISPLRDLFADTSPPGSQNTSLHKRYPMMDRVVHRRPGFSFGLSMFSSRVFNFEYGNTENGRGWFTGQGALYLYPRGTFPFENDFWPTLDFYRLPGTTIDRREKKEFDFTEASRTSDQSWVGGVDLGGRYGSSGMELHAVASGLRAKKSWFFFDDEVICVGSAIHSDEDDETETVVENRKFEDLGKIRAWADGKPLLANTTGELARVHSLYLEGEQINSRVGYVFPQKPALKYLAESRTGRWSDINQYYPNTRPAQKNYFTLYISHGTAPKDESYQYILLPGKLPTETQAYAENPDVEIIACSREVHAVREKRLGILSAHFWVDGAPAAGGLWSDRKAAVMVEETPEKVLISISDPTQENLQTISVNYRERVGETLRLDPGVEILQLSPQLKMRVHTKEGLGRSFSAEFRKGQ